MLPEQTAKVLYGRMLESILTEAGYRTGLYTSPCIDSETECYRINKENISESDFSETVFI